MLVVDVVDEGANLLLELDELNDVELSLKPGLGALKSREMSLRHATDPLIASAPDLEWFSV